MTSLLYGAPAHSWAILGPLQYSCYVTEILPQTNKLLESLLVLFLNINFSKTFIRFSYFQALCNEINKNACHSKITFFFLNYLF